MTPDEMARLKALLVYIRDSGKKVTRVMAYDTAIKLVDEIGLTEDTCPNCGCNELLCGYPKQCTSERTPPGQCDACIHWIDNECVIDDCEYLGIN